MFCRGSVGRSILLVIPTLASSLGRAAADECQRHVRTPRALGEYAGYWMPSCARHAELRGACSCQPCPRLGGANMAARSATGGNSPWSRSSRAPRRNCSPALFLDEKMLTPRPCRLHRHDQVPSVPATHSCVLPSGQEQSRHRRTRPCAPGGARLCLPQPSAAACSVSSPTLAACAPGPSVVSMEVLDVPALVLRAVQPHQLHHLIDRGAPV